MNQNIKIPQSLEQAYQDHLVPEKIRIMRVLCTLGILLYLLFSLADLWALPSSIYQSLLIRSIVITGLVFTFLSTYFKSFITYYNYILPVPYLLAAFGIEAMIFLSHPSDYASNVYFAGLILVIMILFSWSHLKVSNLIVTTGVIIGMYVAIEMGKHQFTSAELLPILLPNLFFLCSAAVIGLVTQFIRDSYLRKNFLLQQSLQEAYDEKSKEADNHEHLANHDQLTGLPNRRYSKERLDGFLDRAKELNMSMVILYLDLNGFKKVNDIYGHNAGDEVLRVVARRLKLCIRNGDCVARLGGDEFVVGLIVEKHELDIAEKMREEIENAISRPINFEGYTLQISTSVGMASYPASGNKVTILMEIADKRMYNEKKSAKESTQPSDKNCKKEPINKDSILIFPG